MKTFLCTYSFLQYGGMPWSVGDKFLGPNLDAFSYGQRRFFKEVPNEEGTPRDLAHDPANVMHTMVLEPVRR